MKQSEYEYLSKYLGPEIVGEPFWALMLYENDIVYPKLLSVKGLSIIFRSEYEAKVFKMSTKVDNCVVRGINRKLMNRIINREEQEFIMPLCKAVTHKKVTMIKVTGKQLLYYAKYNKFQDEELEKTFNNCDEVYEKFRENNTSTVFDEVFNKLIDYNQMKNNKFENLSSILEEYKSTLIRSRREVKKELINIGKESNKNSQSFTRAYRVGEYDIEISWSIDRANEIIKKDNIDEKDIKISDVINSVDSSNIVRTYEPKIDKPIIVVESGITKPKYLVLDGNHRLMKTYNSGQKVIKAYILNTDECINAMLTTYDKNLYIIMKNINIISEYLYCDIYYNKPNLYSLREAK